MQTQRIIVNKRSLKERINRKLAEDCLKLKANRGYENWKLGKWLIVDGSEIVRHGFTLEALGRELGVLADFEDLKSSTK